MTNIDNDDTGNMLLRLALPALKRAALNARKEAIYHNTKLIYCQNDHIVKLTPDEVREEIPDY